MYPAWLAKVPPERQAAVRYRLLRHAAKTDPGVLTAPPRSPSRHSAYNRWRLYGVTFDDFDRMMSEQDGRCANAGCRAEFTEDEHPEIDHDHATGEVRGLLCGLCNRALGHVKDDVARLQGLIDYLTRHGLQP